MPCDYLSQSAIHLIVCNGLLLFHYGICLYFSNVHVTRLVEFMESMKRRGADGMDHVTPLF